MLSIKMPVLGLGLSHTVADNEKFRLIILPETVVWRYLGDLASDSWRFRELTVDKELSELLAHHFDERSCYAPLIQLKCGGDVFVMMICE
jgi:hypothetical protein